MVTGCGLGTAHTATPPAATSSAVTTPTATPDPNLEIINTIIHDSQSESLEAANQAELDMAMMMRDQSGARAAFGNQADAIFLQIDQDKAAALEEMVNRATGAVNTPLKVSAQLVNSGISGTTRAFPLDKPHYVTMSMVQAMMTIMMAIQIANPDNENAIGDIMEGGAPVGAPGTHYSFQPLLFGSRLEATGTITTTVTAPYPYEESIEYDLSMEVCPDAEGNVPIHLSLHSSASLLGGGVQLGGDTQLTGHVNDEGALASTDYNSTYQGSRQPIHGAGENLGTVNTFFESQENVTIYTNPGNPSTGTQRYTRQSSETDQQFNQDALQEMRFLNIYLTTQALNTANEKWTTGYCLEITVPELPDGTKTVQPNSETRFTANVHHKFEGTDLPLPVIATLSDGQVSVNPSGSKVPAPASFTYKAAEEINKSATVNLVTRSKRGVATLDVNFKTVTQGWKLEGMGPVSSNGIKITGGLSCDSPYGPWEFSLETIAPGQTSLTTTKIPFSEDGKAIATYEEHAIVGPVTTSVIGTGSVSITINSGGYQMDFDAYKITSTVCGAGLGLGCKTSVVPKPAWVINIIPADPGQCPRP
jgi:hypothetical protein